MLVWNCLRHSTRGERKGFTKYRTNAREVFPFGQEKVNLIVSLLHCLSLDRLSWKSWRIYSNVFQRTKFHRSYIYIFISSIFSTTIDSPLLLILESEFSSESKGKSKSRFQSKFLSFNESPLLHCLCALISLSLRRNTKRILVPRLSSPWTN